MAFFGATLLLRGAITSLYGLKPSLESCWSRLREVTTVDIHAASPSLPATPVTHSTLYGQGLLNNNLSDEEKLGNHEGPIPARQGDYEVHMAAGLSIIWPRGAQSRQSSHERGYLTDDDKALIALVGQSRYQAAMAAGELASLYPLLDQDEHTHTL